MQQDESTLTRLLTALPEEPDVEAALAAIHARVAVGQGNAPLPADLFAGLDRRPDPDVLVLHPTASSGRPAPSSPARPKTWVLVAAVAAAMLVAGGLHLAWPQPPPTAPHPPPALASPAPSVPPAVDPQPRVPPPRDALDVAQAVVALGALRDEDPSAKPPRTHDRRPRRYRRARKIWRKGRLAYEAGDTEEARARFAECLTIDAEHSACLNSQGRMAADAHDPEAARKLFERALAADAANPYPMVNLATLAMLRRDYAEAEGLLKTAIDVAPQLPDARRLQERLQYLQRHLDAPD